MKNLLNAEETLDLVEMKSAGYGSRHIAKLLGISKSSVNNYFKLWLKSQVPAESSLQTEFQKAVNRGLYGTEYKPEDVAFKKSPLDYRPIPEAVFQEAKKATEALGNAFDSAVDEFGKPRLASTLVGMWKRKEKTESRKPKVLLVDYETAPTIAATFGRWKQNIGQDNVLEEGGWILTAAYKWLGESEIHTLSNKEDIAAKSDMTICCNLFDLYSQADAVLAHNNQGFDHKVLQTRCLINGLPVLPSVKVLDTLIMAKKKLKFNSNRLDSIATVLGYGGKVKHSGIKMWLNVMNGDDSALDEMLHYNKVDVELLENVYMELRRVGHTGSDYNAALYHTDDKVRCRTCGSDSIEPTGRSVTTGLSEFKEYRCGSCGAIHRNRSSVTTKEDRKKLLV